MIVFGKYYQAHWSNVGSCMCAYCKASKIECQFISSTDTLNQPSIPRLILQDGLHYKVPDPIFGQNQMSDKEKFSLYFTKNSNGDERQSVYMEKQINNILLTDSVFNFCHIKWNINFWWSATKMALSFYIKKNFLTRAKYLLKARIKKRRTSAITLHLRPRPASCIPWSFSGLF